MNNRIVKIIALSIFAIVIMYGGGFAYVKMIEAENYSQKLYEMNQENQKLKEMLNKCQLSSAE